MSNFSRKEEGEAIGDAMYQNHRKVSQILSMISSKETEVKPLGANVTVEDLRGQLKVKDELIRYKNELLRLKDEEIQENARRLSVKERETENLTQQVRSFQMKTMGVPRAKRAEGISAKPYTTQPSRAQRFSKSKEIALFLQNSIQENAFLKKFGEHQIEEMVACMNSQTSQRLEVIIKEGDSGNHLFVIEEGRVEVSKAGIKQCILGKGSVFGELALLYNDKRTATVKALMTCKLWSIERESFQKIMINCGLESQQRLVNFLKSCDTFKNFTELHLNQIADVLEEVEYRYGDYIIRQGTKGDCFYILSKGKVRVTQTEEGQDKETEIKVMNSGDNFGERALEGDEVRTANVIAIEETGVTCFVLERDPYIQLISRFRPSIDDGQDQTGQGHETGESFQTPKETKKIKLEDIKIVSTLGIGGFGRVELVTLGADKKSYALKKMLKQHILDTKQQLHVCSEREILAECDSNFICKLYATNHDSRYIYILLEACLGGELWTLLNNKKAFDEPTTRFFTACAVEALSYLHQRKIVYRDLKPENLIMDAAGYLKLVDFGFAKKLKNGQKTWTFCGTPEYIAPEVIQNKGHDKTADLWSLGVLIYELHSGSPPFSHTDHIKTYNAILGGIHSVEFPKRFSKNAERLIKMLCRDNARERLGAGLLGFDEVRQHRWFMGFNWSALKNRTCSVPLLPKVKNATDTHNFDDFPPLDESKFFACQVDTSSWDKDF